MQFSGVQKCYETSPAIRDQIVLAAPHRGHSPCRGGGALHR